MDKELALMRKWELELARKTKTIPLTYKPYHIDKKWTIEDIDGRKVRVDRIVCYSTLEDQKND